MKLTIKDIARLANVSIATVSMVVNKKDQRISEDTKKRVLDVIDKYNYVPNRVASSMVTKNTKSLGLVLPDITNPFFPGLARGVEDRASKNNWNIILCNTDNDFKKECNYLEILQEKMVDGIILTASNHHSYSSSIMNKINIPIITLDRDIDDVKHLGTVKTDNETGAFEAVKFMINRGYRKILHLSGPLSVHTAKSRYDGYLKAHIESDLLPPKENVYQGDFTHESGYNLTNELISNNVAFDSLFCGDDLMALGALKALAEHNIAVPETGVVGFDDVYISDLITPALTTVHQPIYEMGFKAADLLINHIEKNEKLSGEGFVYNMKTELKIRSTTK